MYSFESELGGPCKNVPVRENLCREVTIGRDGKSWPLLRGALVLVEIKLYNVLETENGVKSF